ncbi:hypothetical protein [Gimesia algae]|uniref:Uncharacterized protein n=1 Tax=Gimesia algae TaxID=2527971 RepID=A0A517VA90_9PLAN|nr:hypothetical protein [Gimesia algae]QDT89930.1 hypothetical protein Pan161_15630 [Gimesia algae]
MNRPRTNLAVVLALLVALPSFAQDAKVNEPWIPDDPDLRNDLATMQGRWERVTRDENGKVVYRQEKLIKDDLEILTNMSVDGKYISTYRQTKFHLEKHGPVRVFYCGEATMLSGKWQGRTFPMDFAFLYRIDDEVFLDAPGMFESRRTYQRDPSIYIWKRIKDRSKTHSVSVDKQDDGSVRMGLTISDDDAAGETAEKLVAILVGADGKALSQPLKMNPAGQLEAIIKPTSTGRHSYYIRTESGDLVIGGEAEID